MSGRKRKLSPAQEAELARWWTSQKTMKQKAAELGICETTIYSALIRQGVIFQNRPTSKDQAVRRHIKEQEKAALAGGRGAAVRPSNAVAGRQGMSTRQLYHGTIS